MPERSHTAQEEGGLARRWLEARVLHGLRRARWLGALVGPRSIDDYLTLLHPTLAAHEVRARITKVCHETSTAVSLWMRPNAVWRGFVPGQFVRLAVSIDGIRHERCFSISSAPGDERGLRLTLRVLPGGRISGWARTRARPGDVVTLSQALGRFVLPNPLPPKLLFISGGSGIAPLLSMVGHLVETGYAGRIVCLCFARREVICAGELEALARRHGDMHLVPCLTRASTSAAPMRFSLEALGHWLPDWRAYETFLCGPAPLQDAVTRIWEAHDRLAHLHVERFAPGPVTAPAVGPSDAALRPGAPHATGGGEPRVRFIRSGRSVAGDETMSLLEQAERAGLHPPYGCRMGVCHTCTCTKRSGVVRNQLTGAIDAEPDRTIQLCINVPVSDVTLDL